MPVGCSQGARIRAGLGAPTPKSLKLIAVATGGGASLEYEASLHHRYHRSGWSLLSKALAGEGL